MFIRREKRDDRWGKSTGHRPAPVDGVEEGRERETEIDREKEQEGKRVSDKCFGGDFLPGLLWPFILLLLALSSHLA